MARKKDKFDPLSVSGGQMAAAGDDTEINGGSDDADTSRVNGIAGAELLQIIESIERLMEEKDAVTGDIKEKFGESKGRGFDNKAIRTIIRMRKQDRNERLEEESILQTYLVALGME